MKIHTSFQVWLVLISLFIAGCETNAITRRINEKPEIYASLAPDQKAYVSDGIVFPGDSLDMAYIALGKPDAVETRKKDDITVVMWTYEKYYPSGELEEFLTKYSRSRNPNLLRGVHIEVGKILASDHVPNRKLIPGLEDDDDTSGTMSPLFLPEIPVYRLYVFIYLGKISDVKIESLDGTVFMWLEEAIEMEKANKLRKARNETT